MRLARTIGLRVLFGILSLIFITFVTFVAGINAPGDPAEIIAGEKANRATIERIRRNEGLDRPWPERYGRFLVGAVQLDFGRSYFGARPTVRQLIAENLPMTLRIAFWSILIAAVTGVTLGCLAAIHQNGWQDRLILTVSTLGVTLPTFVLGPLLIFAFSVQLDLLPIGWSVNRVAPDVYYLILPIVILAARPGAMLTRLTRASMVDTLGQEFIRLAVAKGVPFRRLVIRHALRNAILPVVTAMGTSFGFLLTGSFIVESLFSLPGLGFLAINAIYKRDTPVILAAVLVTGALFILINLLVDILLPLLDPRVREART